MKRSPNGIAALALATIVALTGPAFALPPLNQNTYIMERLVSAMIGDIIRRTCPTIHPRIFTFFRERESLRQYTLKLGYNMDQINDFLRDKSEQKSVKSMAERYMEANGVVKGDVESYCRLGRYEIARNSITGTLLYESR